MEWLDSACLGGARESICQEGEGGKALPHGDDRPPEITSTNHLGRRRLIVARPRVRHRLWKGRHTNWDGCYMAPRPADQQRDRPTFDTGGAPAMLMRLVDDIVKTQTVTCGEVDMILGSVDYAKVNVAICPNIKPTIARFHPGFGEIYFLPDGWIHIKTYDPKTE